VLILYILANVRHASTSKLWTIRFQFRWLCRIPWSSSCCARLHWSRLSRYATSGKPRQQCRSTSLGLSVSGQQPGTDTAHPNDDDDYLHQNTCMATTTLKTQLSQMTTVTTSASRVQVSFFKFCFLFFLQLTTHRYATTMMLMATAS
jgi:hypothetical protein